ncbi:MAG: MBOAT family protein [Candidatus Shapirobacteria bacterium]|nr:MBOAT family protein [Candidatus Shapirobacteria bacterium]MDD4410131.1 MBOAT family protein [Candidatus Shapirobacteria bacterium]
MLFTSPVFLFLFLPILLVIYYLSPTKFRNLLLLLASLFFYAWGEGLYVLILISMILVNYIFGLIINKTTYKKIWLTSAIIFDLGYIFYFKYLIFAMTTLSTVLLKTGKGPLELPQIIMPLGISFVTFHLISYVFDIYRKDIRAEKNVLNFSLYILMFPHLIAGPIVRYKDIGVQIKKRQFSKDQFVEGIKRFVMGLAKKVLIANVMAAVADQIFAIFPQYLTGQIVWLALFSYTLQIYFDFSGYSDMAIGLAKMFGFNFKENFNFPYIANSIKDFWRRWHISLSSWFRDYLYIPLGGNRKGKIRTLVNIAIVFTLTGLWHGSNWHFIFWGVYFGFFLILENLFLGKVLDKLWFGWRHLYTMGVVIIGWLFFRINSLNYAVYLLKVMVGINPNKIAVYQLGNFATREYLAVMLIALVAATPIGRNLYQKIVNKIPAMEIITTGGLLILSIMQLAGDTYNPFIYFRF